MLVSSAYGRQYLDEESVLRDWNDGKDFTAHLPTGQTEIINKLHLKTGENVRIRYRRFTREVSITIK